MDLLLGLDVGTTATKALLFDLEGRVVASASQGYELRTPQPRWVEQNAEELWRAVVQTARHLLAQTGPGDRVLALAQSSQGGTTIAVDAARPAALSGDQLDGSARRSAGRRASGPPMAPSGSNAPPAGISTPACRCSISPGCASNRPEVFSATRYWLFVNDYVTRRLTGRLCMNPSDAGITQLMDIETGDWDARLLNLAGIRREQLSPLSPPARSSAGSPRRPPPRPGLSPETLVVNGAHDQYCAAVGTGVTQPGKVLLSCGTAWVLLAVPESLEIGRQSGMSLSRHAVAGRWGAIRSLGGVGASLEWLMRNAWAGASYAEVDAGAARSPLGANGLFCRPLSGGHMSNAERGGFYGLNLAHTRDDLARAVMEGIAYELRWALAELAAHGVAAHELVMVGGAAKSPLWPQIVADVTGLPVVLPSVDEAAARGAAILAGVGAGIFADAESGLAAFRGQETQLDA